MQNRIRTDQPLREIPLGQRRRMARSPAAYAEQSPDRDRAMAEAYRTGVYSMQAIVDHFGVGRMTVSQAVKKHQLDRFNGQWAT